MVGTEGRKKGRKKGRKRVLNGARCRRRIRGTIRCSLVSKDRVLLAESGCRDARIGSLVFPPLIHMPDNAYQAEITAKLAITHTDENARFWVVIRVAAQRTQPA